MSLDFKSWNLMSPDQRDLVTSLNQNTQPLPDQATLTDLFDPQVTRHGQRTAISYDGGQLTYAELDRRANQIAHLLQQLGLRPDSIVVVLMERSPAMYIALLAVLKAGGAYLPLDPAYPRERIASIVLGSKPQLVITVSHYLHLVEGYGTDYAVLIDGVRQFQKAKKRAGKLFDIADIAGYPETRPPAQHTAQNLAYVIYTSGSTGAPKGVMIEHRGVVNLVLWAIATFAIDQEARIMQSYAPYFDASVQEIFMALAGGATLVLAAEDVQLSPPRLLSWLDEQAITYWDTVPTLWYQVAEHVRAIGGGARVALPFLKTIVLGGEALRSDKIRLWLEHVEPTHTLFNVYGPTESTVSTTFYPVSGSESWQSMPIGKPLPNVEVYILNADLRLCPPNATGEIYIGGVGLARGYLNAPDLTAERFVPNSFLKDEGLRMKDEDTGFILHPSSFRLYRTGDLGRLLPDGNIVFVGRRDEQVKVRGFRIELSEIEAHLRGLLDIDEVAVIVKDDQDQETRKIIAFYRLASGKLDSEALRAALKEKLPAYMIPHHFVEVSELPRAANNKIDKNTLLQLPLNESGVQEETYQPPTTRSELLLARIWKAVLHLETVGVNQDFFSLGGDSILSIMIRHRCEQEGIYLQTIDLFRYPTIRSLAQYIEEHAKTRQPPQQQQKQATAATAALALSSEQQKLLPRHTQQVLPLLPLQHGMLYEDALYGRTIYIPQVVHQCAGTIDVEAFDKAVNILIGRHEALRTIFRTDIAQEPVQIILSDASYQVEQVDICHIPPDLQDRHIQDMLEQERLKGFDVAQWPLFRITIYFKDDTHFDIVWTIHHAIMDGWSTSICYKDLSKIYSGIVLKRYIPLTPLRNNFSDYVSSYLARDFNQARAFWREYISTIAPINLPRSFHGKDDDGWEVRQFDIVLSPEQSAQLRAFARASATTINIVCLSAYFLLLQYICRQDDLTIAFVTSGRSEDLDGVLDLVGNTINTLPLSINLAGAEAFGDVVQRVKQGVLTITEYDYLGFSEIARLIPANASPLRLETLFIFENYPSPDTLGIDTFHGFTTRTMLAFESSGFPLSVIGSEENDLLDFRFEYATHLFDERTIRTWANIFRTILGQIDTASPND